MRIACLCPTYKRPECLPNAAMCYINQFIHRHFLKVETHLFILDDANQYTSELIQRPSDPGFCTITIKSQNDRLPSLPEKYQALVDLANNWDADAYVIWEDDDVFLPWHLSNIHHALESGVQFYRHPKVWSTYGQHKRGMIMENAAGRFHSSWAFTRELYEKVGGYMGLIDSPNSVTPTKQLNFDQRMGAALAAVDHLGIGDKAYCPSYVYRWGNSTYHGSAHGDSGYATLWAHLGREPAPFQGRLKPNFDSETEILWRLGLSHHASHLQTYPDWDVR
jgi:hypothetical protein